MRSRRTVALTQVLILTMVTGGLVGTTAPAASAEPSSVTIAGSLQSELGCPGRLAARVRHHPLAFDADDDVWQATFRRPAGSWEYKAALDGTWDENYGLGAVRDGPNIPLTSRPTRASSSTTTTRPTGSRTARLGHRPVAPGSFQSELGCAVDWDPSCLRSWLQDPDGDGIGRFSTSVLPPGDYEAKVAIDRVLGPRTTGPAARRTAPTSPSRSGPPATSSPSRTTRSATSSTIDVAPAEPVDDAALVRRAGPPPVRGRGPVLRDPDRFNDGDPSNNCGDFAGACVANDTQENVLTHGYLPSDKGYYHGGDLEGLRRKLPYLRPPRR